MSRFTRELQALRNRIKKLKKNQGDNYSEAWFHHVITGELPTNIKYRERIEHEQRQIEMMRATLPYSNKEDCKRERSKIFGFDVCVKCENRTGRCGNENNDEYGYLKDDEIEDDEFKEENIVID